MARGEQKTTKDNKKKLSVKEKAEKKKAKQAEKAKG